jgi:hypothetical protein
MTFIHRFSRSLTCTMTVSDNPPANGENFVQQVEWTERPKPKHTREYVRWCHTVYSHLADHWHLRLMQAVQTGPRLWEFWGYEPGLAPKLLKKSSD